MVFPTKEIFAQKAIQGNVIPVYKRLLGDLETPVSAYMKIAKGPYSFLLESVEGGEKIGRYSIMGRNPFMVFSARKQKIKIQEGKHVRSFQTEGNPLDALQTIMERFRVVEDPHLPRFCGGAVGYAGYGMVRYFDQIPQKNKDMLKLPDLYFMIADTLVVFDHIEHSIIIIANAVVEDNVDDAYNAAIEKIASIEKDLKKSLKKEVLALGDGNTDLDLESNFKQSEFESIVIKAKDYIRAGDIFQVVLSQRFETRISRKPLDYYRALRSINPSPYMFFLKFGNFNMVGTSPEILVRCENGSVEVRPIAGTRPRGNTQEQDLAYEKTLLEDPKECAEHIMLVDLGRNDIGRVCDYNSVHMTEFMVIERYSHVMHIVSDVLGKLKKGMNSFDVMKATFPAGTVSGAPKIRAMQIIDELENIARGPYAGAVGYFGFSGNMDTCITIRTILLHK
ncbi:MAG: anthranilate synthase component I, partial [Chlamydiota bacterium]|nr:anthranilate synthase component I [Chlamydiota bacterium]